ncbi:MAG: peptidase S8 and S53 subtilisin kexin sedolisin [Bacteroidetes bacterium OLB11]|nr:MAG: peptidase S8 and S53 subtilisin kexin sedolisin [Bacteroidetes bacterium OLB11]
MKAKNKSSNQYQFADYKIQHIQSSNVYYRIKQIDIDGKFTYSKIKQVILNEKNEVQILPNPNRGYISLIGASKFHTMYIYSYTGLLISKYDIKNQTEINVSHLNSGIYFVTFTNDHQKVIQKMAVE